MVEITVQKLKDVDLDSLATFAFNTLQESVFRSDSRTLDTVKASLQESAEDANNLMVVASRKESDGIIGCLGFYTGFSAMVFSNEWHPLVSISKDREMIARELIRNFAQYSEESGFERVEALLSPISDVHSEIREEYRNWFLSERFYLATEEVFMEADLSNFQIPEVEPKLPEGYEWDSFDNRKNEEIRDSFFETFLQAEARLFIDMTEKQRETTFEYWFRRSSPMHRSSQIVIKDDEVVGYSVVRPETDSVNIGPFGIHPDYKGKGIGKALLHRVMSILLKDGVEVVKLEADIINTPAINLYKKYGFEEKDTQEYYAWRVD